VVRVGDGHAVRAGDAQIAYGRDILGVGDFEDEDIDDERHEADFWEVQPGREFGTPLGVEGSSGARIRRRRGEVTDAYLNPVHRILVPARAELTAIGLVEAPRGARVIVQLSWYPDTRGASTSQTVHEVELAPDEDGWTAVRLDAVAPADAVAVGFFVRLVPPTDTEEVTAAFDNLALVEWSARGTSPDAQYGLTSVVAHLPGGHEWAARTGGAIEFVG
jgi:hypothetical protein